MLGLCLAVVCGHIYSQLELAKLRRMGLYPEKGRATEDDILKLLKAGHRIYAMRCHRELHGSSLKQAKQAITAIEASCSSDR